MDGWIGSAINVGGAFLIAIGGYIMKRHNTRLDGMDAKTGQTANDLARYMLDSEKRFAKESSLQMSLARIHDRLDEHAKEARETATEIRSDIKELISKVSIKHTGA